MNREWGSVLTSWPAYLFVAVAFAFWGMSTLTTDPDGFDTLLGICFLLVGIVNGRQAVRAYRSRPGS